MTTFMISEVAKNKYKKSIVFSYDDDVDNLSRHQLSHKLKTSNLITK